jgi:hypothetical protein
MASITGTIRIGEANAACGKIGRRQRGPIYVFYLWMTAFAAIGGALGYAVDRWTTDWVYSEVQIYGWAIGAWLGIVAYVFAGRKIGVWRFRKLLTAKGTPLDLPTRLEITPDVFFYEMADVHSSAKWSAVSEIFHAKGYWIFLVQAWPWFAADRFFASEEEKRAFLREALSYMSEEARARSPDAVKFVETGNA